VTASLRVTVPDDRWSDPWVDVPERPRPSGVEIRVWDMVDPLPADGSARPGADVVVAPYMSPGDWLGRLPEVEGLRVLQTLTAGYEGILERLPAGVTLCTAAGVHDASTAELAVGLAIAVLRGLGQAALDATSGTWDHVTRPSLADRRVLLIGSGSVGSAIAARLAPFEVTVTRVASRARDDAGGHLHGPDELPALLPRHDVVVLACPLTDATRGMVDAEFLAALPDGALVVNIARGPVVVTDALLAELTSGRLMAAMDVVDPEPLPADHPLWQAPNVLISPHVGGDTTAFPPRARALLRDQIERMLDGRPLRHVITRGGG
jgi:phosphoglycerate dehydrogenase-like enzyme